MLNGGQNPCSTKRLIVCKNLFHYVCMQFTENLFMHFLGIVLLLLFICVDDVSEVIFGAKKTNDQVITAQVAEQYFCRFTSFHPTYSKRILTPFNYMF